MKTDSILPNFVRQKRNAIYLAVLLLIFVVLVFEQSFINYKKLAPSNPAVSEEYIQALKWLKKHSNPGDIILSDWTQGHQIVALADRRVVATSKVYPSEAKDVAERYRDIAYFFFSQSEEKAMEIVGKYGANFIFLRKNFDWASTISKFADWSLQDLLQNNRLTPKGRQKTVIGRMLQRGEFDNFKLVYDSPDFLIYKVTDKSPALSQDEKEFVLVSARRALDLFVREGKRLKIDSIPDSLSGLRQKKTVDVTLWNRGELRGSQIATNDNVVESVIEATIRAARDPRFKIVSKNELNDIRIEIFIFGDKISVNSIETLFKQQGDILGLKGFYLKNNGHEGYFLPSVLNQSEWQLEEFLTNLCIQKAGLSKDCWRDPKTQIMVFGVEDFIENDAGRAMDVWRTVPIYQSGELTPRELKISLEKAADWTLKLQDDDGFFRQGYNPVTDEFSFRNDLLRNAAASWSLLEFFKQTPNYNYLNAALKNLDYLYRGNIIRKNHEGLTEIVTENRLPLAALNFTILSLVASYEISGQKVYLDDAGIIGDFLVEIQNDDGSFPAYYGEGASKEGQIIYDGQALYALGRLFNVVQGKKYLEAAKKAGEQLIKRFRDDRLFGKEQSLPANAWLVNAFSQLFRIGGELRHADFSLEVADWLVDYQHAGGPAADSGIFDDTTKFDFPFHSGIGKISEALVDAYLLAEEIGRPKEKYLEALIRAMRWLKQMQYDEENTYFLTASRAEKSIGGFRTNYFQHFSRIDNASHYLIAGVGLLNILEK